MVEASSLASLCPSWPRVDPSTPVKLGVLVNPRARGLRRPGMLQGLREAAQGRATYLETGAVAEVHGAVERLTGEGVNVLAVAGGDGSLHHAMQALARRAGHWPGKLAVLRGGTLNIVGRGCGVDGATPGEALAALAARLGGNTWGALPQRRVRLLRVEAEGQPDRHGFIFGSEAVKNALELYDQFGGGYEGLGRFLFEVGRGYLLNTPLWQREKWRLDPVPFGLTLGEGPRLRQIARFSAAIASTIDLALGSGAIRAITRPPGAAGFFARVITETRTGPLLKMIPDLMRALPLEAAVDAPEAREMQLRGAYTLDGECFGESSRGTERARPVRVAEGPEVAFVAGP